MTLVELNAHEVLYAKHIGNSRHQAALNMGFTSDVDSHIKGFKGEMAYCKQYNCYPHPTVGDLEKNDVLVLGYRVEVKANFSGQDLILRDADFTRSSKSDLFVSVLGQDSTDGKTAHMDIQGGMTFEDALKYPQEDRGFGMVRFIPPEALDKLSSHSGVPMGMMKVQQGLKAL